MRMIFAAVIISLSISGAFAETPTEEQQRAACADDALRFCAAYVPDRSAITQCMRSKRLQLSAQCRAVMDVSDHDQNTPTKR